MQRKRQCKTREKHTAGPKSWFPSSILFKGKELISRTTGGEMLVISVSTSRWWSRYLTYGCYGGTQPNPFFADLLPSFSDSCWVPPCGERWPSHWVHPQLLFSTHEKLHNSSLQMSVLWHDAPLGLFSATVIVKLLSKYLVYKKVSCHGDRSVLFCFMRLWDCSACMLWNSNGKNAL